MPRQAPTHLHHRSYGRCAFLAFALVIALGLVALGVRSLFQPDRPLEQGLPAPLDGQPGTDAREAKTRTARQEPTLPTAAQVMNARAFAESRAGVVSFAVIDTSDDLHCYRCRTRYTSASVVKAMLLVAYLTSLAEENRGLTPSHHAQLEAMIRVSDNQAATEIYSHVGDAGLRRLAKQAGMRDFSVSGGWATARITAADQARFFTFIDTPLSAKDREYASQLLSSIVASQAWGIPGVSRPEWRTLFKGGWRRTRRGQLVHQVARLERGDAVMAIAILTDGNPRDPYGRATIRGIARRLLDPGSGGS
jgi:beta-lactamase family protein